MKRREFLKSLGLSAAAATFFDSVLSQAAISPISNGSKGIDQIEHVVVFMQENRSFDHYFGHLSGVLGYNDRFPLRQPNGKVIWSQPRMDPAAGDILPFHLDTKTSSAQILPDLDHGWESQHGAIAGGLNNAWPINKSDMTMGYYLRDDIPFHYMLADTFTICDHYFCSIIGPTSPNRLVLWSGTVDPTGKGGGPLIDDNDHMDNPSVPAFTWTTFAERLQSAGISWQVYQEGRNEIDGNPFTGNYTDNALEDFAVFANAPEDSELYRRGMSIRTINQLKRDVVEGKLPQVSWIVAPGGYSEHPSYAPAYGAVYIARVLEALSSNPEVWSKTALFLNYDENDGFFDHVVPPQPPTPVRPGKSTVSTEGEVHDFVNPDHEPLYIIDYLPYGLGARVPMTVISPWSRGGYVCSEVFDHTSVIRFVERRFGVKEPNITPWRRSVCGDLTSAFNFDASNNSKLILPDTTAFIKQFDAQSKLPPKFPPAPGSQDRAIIPQEVGIRPARPLPYRLYVEIVPGPTGYDVRMSNHSATGACFYAYWQGIDQLPNRYTVGAGDTLGDILMYPLATNADMIIYGPNSFIRQLQGHGPSDLHIVVGYTPHGDLEVNLKNKSNRQLAVRLKDESYGTGERIVQMNGFEHQILPWDLQKSNHWYDLTVQCDNHSWRYAGHVEDGRDSMTDPARSEPVLA